MTRKALLGTRAHTPCSSPWLLYTQQSRSEAPPSGGCQYVSPDGPGDRNTQEELGETQQLRATDVFENKPSLEH